MTAVFQWKFFASFTDVGHQVVLFDIKDVELRYHEGLKVVLKGVNVAILGGQNVCIVGLTGSGKTSMRIALLRIVELSRGSVTVVKPFFAAIISATYARLSEGCPLPISYRPALADEEDSFKYDHGLPFDLTLL